MKHTAPQGMIGKVLAHVATDKKMETKMSKRDEQLKKELKKEKHKHKGGK